MGVLRERGYVGIEDGRFVPLERGRVATAFLEGFLRRQRFVDLTAGIVAGHHHPLHTRVVTFDDLARCPWIDYDAAANIAPSDPRPSLPGCWPSSASAPPPMSRTSFAPPPRDCS